MSFIYKAVIEFENFLLLSYCRVHNHDHFKTDFSVFFVFFYFLSNKNYKVKSLRYK